MKRVTLFQYNLYWNRKMSFFNLSFRQNWRNEEIKIAAWISIWSRSEGFSNADFWPVVGPPSKSSSRPIWHKKENRFLNASTADSTDFCLLWNLNDRFNITGDDCIYRKSLWRQQQTSLFNKSLFFSTFRTWYVKLGKEISNTLKL